MAWADNYIKQLEAGGTVRFRPRGGSMTGLIESGQLVTVRPREQGRGLDVGQIVLCRVQGAQYLHKIVAVSSDGRYQIGNNKGRINGWANEIYGVVVSVED